MPKEKPGAPSSRKAAAKAQKKAKAAQKTARKEKKKTQRDKDDQDDQDLEDILEKVHLLALAIALADHAVFPVDETRMGGGAYSHGRTRRRSSQ